MRQDLKDIANEIAKSKNDLYQRALARFISFFGKKKGSEVSVNERLSEELHKPVIKKL